ncbi:MAG: alanine racemase [Gammaproteobacteria bacterium]
MSRTARAIINTSALQHNLKQVRNKAPNSKIMAVVKANAYGHGLERVARALVDADAFAVACLDEARRIRSAGLAHPIVLLEGVFSADELEEAGRSNFHVVVHSERQLAWIASFRGAPLRVWLKMDTGMNRLGFRPEYFRKAWETLSASSSISRPIGLLTHLARANDRDQTFTQQQIDRFMQATNGMEGPRSIANSAGIYDWPGSHIDWIRPGIVLYGVSPFPDSTGPLLGLRPAMHLVSELIAIRNVKAGETVGYGGTWKAEEDTTIGIVAFGYGDGYPRHVESGAPVRIATWRVPLVGTVSMDMLAVDMATLPEGFQPGAPVELWGHAIPVEEVASSANTIPYELLLRLTERVKMETCDE